MVLQSARRRRYAFGFGASRWGWKSREYMEEVLRTFRNESFPIDYVVLDFEWFTKETDYNYTPKGDRAAGGAVGTARDGSRMAASPPGGACRAEGRGTGQSHFARELCRPKCRAIAS